jgi:hypothetical protein
LPPSPAWNILSCSTLTLFFFLGIQCGWGSTAAQPKLWSNYQQAWVTVNYFRPAIWNLCWLTRNPTHHQLSLWWLC